MLFINNTTVEYVLTMADCINVLEQAFRQSLPGKAMQRGRLDYYAPAIAKTAITAGGPWKGSAMGCSRFA